MAASDGGPYEDLSYEEARCLHGIAIAVATSGEVEITGADTQDRLTLRPGSAALITPNEGSVSISGSGEAFIAEPGQ